MSMLVSFGAVAEDGSSSLQAKHKSSFKIEVDRNPFWPIGWKPPISTNEGNTPALDIPASDFVVTSITIEKDGRFAIINGKVMQEGQQFGLQMGASTYQLKVKAIEDGRVILARHDQEIAVPLRRK
jgi:hypothetical protein